MSTIQDVSPEQLAKVFYHYHEALSQGNGHDNRERACSWDSASQNQRKLMIAAARLALIELATMPVECRPSRKYYAEPGEAEWGC